MPKVTTTDDRSGVSRVTFGSVWSTASLTHAYPADTHAYTHTANGHTHACSANVHTGPADSYANTNPTHSHSNLDRDSHPDAQANTAFCRYVGAV